MLSVEHEKLLTDYGISTKFASENGVTSFCKEESDRVFSLKEAGIAFPFFDLAGNPLGYRLKLEVPLANQKYAEKSGSNCRVFFLKKDLERLRNPLVPLIISEGEKAALCGAEHLPEYVSIAPTGCWNWVEKKEEALEGLREEDRQQLCQTLQDIPLDRRMVFFCPDSDFFTNPNVYHAGTKLIKRLLERGAFVSLVKLSSKPKIALDDYIFNYGAEKLKMLLSSSFWRHLPEGQKILTSDDLGKKGASEILCLIKRRYYNIAEKRTQKYVGIYVDYKIRNSIS